MNAGFIGYLAAAIAYSLLTILLLTSWRGRLRGMLFVTVVGVSALWAAFAAAAAWHDNSIQFAGYQAFEVLRYVAWFVFLARLFDPLLERGDATGTMLRYLLPASVLFGLAVLGLDLGGYRLLPLVQASSLVTLGITGHLFLSIIGLAMIEQLFRNTAARHRWSVKLLFLGAGGVFVYDFLLYSNALLFRGIDPALWQARGYVNLIAVPLLAITASRNRHWSLDVFVSRDIVLHSATVLGGGLYLLAMAAAGYYLREFGGSWGVVAQTVFSALAVLLLALVLFSSQLRARLRVFLAKHFYRNKYDYRQEWLELTRDLDASSEEGGGRGAAIRGLARLVDCRSGLLWLADETGRYRNTDGWNLQPVEQDETPDSALPGFLADTGYVVTLDEMDTKPEEYAGLELPGWISRVPQAWLIVPLFQQQSLLGFVVLADPLVKTAINWEDRDLLKTAARQVASYLSVLTTSEQLARAQQFEVFNRLSAYMVHDLKNIVAELELITSNAEKHKHNPEFLEDAFGSVRNASGEIRRLLDHLRNKPVAPAKPAILDLAELVREVIARRREHRPVPNIAIPDGAWLAVGEKNRLSSVIGHLVENAQQATAQDGFVHVSLAVEGDDNHILIEDNGCGMDGAFVRERLFRPFDTTRGNAGMGIGMYESREYIRALGGDIGVRSEPGKGTRVRVRLPAHRPAVDSEAQSSPAAAAATPYPAS